MKGKLDIFLKDDISKNSVINFQNQQLYVGIATKVVGKQNKPKNVGNLH